MARKVDTVARYFRRLASFAGTAADYEGILHPEFQSTEFPSVQNPALRTSTLAELLQRVAERRKRYSAQHFEILHQVEGDFEVAIEGAWSGLLSADFAGQKRGKSLKGRFSMFFEFQEDMIRRQRIYETVDPAAP